MVFDRLCGSGHQMRSKEVVMDKGGVDGGEEALVVHKCLLPSRKRGRGRYSSRTGLGRQTAIYDNIISIIYIPISRPKS